MPYTILEIKLASVLIIPSRMSQTFGNIKFVYSALTLTQENELRDAKKSLEMARKKPLPGKLFQCYFTKHSDWKDTLFMLIFFMYRINK